MAEEYMNSVQEEKERIEAEQEKKSATISPRYLNGFKVGDQTIQIDLTDEQTLLQTYIRFKTAKNSWLNYDLLHENDTTENQDLIN